METNGGGYVAVNAGNQDNFTIALGDGHDQGRMLRD